MKIVVLGSGNVAWHLVKAFLQTDEDVVQVYSRNLANARDAANIVKAKFINKVSEIYKNVDLYIIALSDSALIEFSGNTELKNIVSNKLVVHTAGSVDMDILKKLTSNYGIIYPIQTFSKKAEIDLSKVTFCIEANNSSNLLEIKIAVKKLSLNIKEISSKQRKILHVSAVFACNFTNNMYAIADKILTENGMDFSMLHPLIKETTEKVLNNKPLNVQTGPAIRNDEYILNEHIKMLEYYPDLTKIYTFVSQNIKEFSK